MGRDIPSFTTKLEVTTLNNYADIKEDIMNNLDKATIRHIAIELTKLDANVNYLHWMFNNDLMFWSVYDRKLTATRKRITKLERVLKGN